MKKKESSYDNTVAIWTEVRSEQEKLKRAVENLGYNAVICTTNKQFFNTCCFAIIANMDIIQKGFFNREGEKYLTLFRMIESGEVTMMRYNTVSFDIPDDKTILVKYRDTEEIKAILRNTASSINEFVKERKALENPCRRLIFMYKKLTNKDVYEREILMHEILMKANITRSTFYRDLKLLEQEFPGKKIRQRWVGSAFVLVDDD